MSVWLTKNPPPQAGVQDHHGKEARPLLPSVTCGGERAVGQRPKESHHLPPGWQEVRQEVHKTLHSPAGHSQPEVHPAKTFLTVETLPIGFFWGGFFSPCSLPNFPSPVEIFIMAKLRLQYNFVLIQVDKTVPSG